MHAASGSSDISPQPGGWAGVLGTFNNTSEPGGVRACVRKRVIVYLRFGSAAVTLLLGNPAPW